MFLKKDKNEIKNKSSVSQKQECECDENVFLTGFQGTLLAKRFPTVFPKVLTGCGSISDGWVSFRIALMVFIFCARTGWKCQTTERADLRFLSNTCSLQQS